MLRPPMGLRHSASCEPYCLLCSESPVASPIRQDMQSHLICIGPRRQNTQYSTIRTHSAILRSQEAKPHNCPSLSVQPLLGFPQILVAQSVEAVRIFRPHPLQLGRASNEELKTGWPGPQVLPALHRPPGSRWTKEWCSRAQPVATNL